MGVNFDFLILHFSGMDPICDMFIRIKNAKHAGKDTVLIPYSKFKYEIAKALLRASFVSEIERRGKRVKKMLEIAFGDRGISNVRLISKPGRRIYTSAKIGRRQSHGGTLFLSTPKGVLTAAEAAGERVGGELLAEVW